MRTVAIGAALLTIAVGAAYHATKLHCIADDAYIAFRYARQFVDGHGLVFNVGEHVDGYTDFLWVMLLSAGMAFGASAEATALLLGGASLLVLGWAVDALGRAVFGWKWSDRLLALALLAALGPIILACASGLETGLFTAMVLSALALHVRRCRVGGSWFAPGLMFGLATLVRPDGALFAAVTGLHLVGRMVCVRSRQRGLAIASFVAAYACLVVPYWAWRTWYYDALLPNTFYVKVGSAGIAELGTTYLSSFVDEYGIFATVAGLGVVAGLSRGARAASFTALLVAEAAAWIAYVIRAGGDYMPLYRVLVPAVALGAVLATEAFGIARGALVRRNGLRCAFLLVLFAALIGSIVVPSWRTAHESERHRIVDTVAHERIKMTQWLAVGRTLRAEFPSDTTIAVSNAGAIPFESRLFTIDQSGLCDRYTARVSSDPWILDYPGHFIQATRQYLESRRPDLILWRPTIEPWRDEPAAAPPSAAYTTRALLIPDLKADDGTDRFLHLWVRREALSRFAQVPWREVGRR